MPRLGKLTLQSLDDADLFLQEDVYIAGSTEDNEIHCEIQESGFNHNDTWVNGNVPKIIPVSIEGDTSVIYGWFKGDFLPYPYKIQIYIEYEEVEEFKEAEREEK